MSCQALCSGLRGAIPVAPLRKKYVSIRRPFSQAARYKSSSGDPASSRFPFGEGLELSMFHKYKNLPPDGATVPLEEEMCNPEEETCKTPLHVYETRCSHCYGTGWSRLPSNGRRGHLATCVVCHGLGFVRRTTARFTPDDPEKHQIIARPLLWNGKLQKRPKPRVFDTSSLSSVDGQAQEEGTNGSGSSNGASGSSSNGSGKD